MNVRHESGVSRLRNQTLDIFKLIAAFFVVWIHVPFPGTAGELIACIGRAAVPFFFMVSGYFSFGIDAKKSGIRMKRALLLFLYGAVLYVALFSAFALYQRWDMAVFLQSYVPTAQMLAHWLILNTNPFGTHLWFLTALMFCYLGLWVYTTFFGEKKPGYQPLYGAGFLLFAIGLAFSVFADAVEVDFSNYLYRNTLFFGFPMFALGIFLREYEERIKTNFRLTVKKLVGLILFGGALSIVEWRGIAVSDIHIGAVLLSGSMLLLAGERPRISGSSQVWDRLVRKFDGLSLWIYITHIAVYRVYGWTLQKWVDGIPGGTAEYLHPILVAVITVMAYFPLEWLLRKLRGRFVHS